MVRFGWVFLLLYVHILTHSLAYVHHRHAGAYSIFAHAKRFFAPFYWIYFAPAFKRTKRATFACFDFFMYTETCEAQRISIGENEIPPHYEISSISQLNDFVHHAARLMSIRWLFSTYSFLLNRPALPSTTQSINRCCSTRNFNWRYDFFQTSHPFFLFLWALGQCGMLNEICQHQFNFQNYLAVDQFRYWPATYAPFNSICVFHFFWGSHSLDLSWKIWIFKKHEEKNPKQLTQNQFKCNGFKLCAGANVISRKKWNQPTNKSTNNSIISRWC